MSELRAYLGLYARGDASQKVKELERGFEQLATRGARHMGQLSRAAGVMGQGLDNLGNRYTALLSGAAGVGAIHQVAQLDERFTRLGINADKSREEMDKLKLSIFETASQKDIRVDPTQILAAVEQIVEKTGDLEYAKDSLKTLGYVIQATGSQGAHVGALVAEFQKLGIEGERGVLMAMDTLVTQGKAGAFTLQNLSTQGEKAVSAYAAMGYRGQEAVQAMGALLQISRMGTGSAEQATTAYENLLGNIIKKRKELQAHGIKVLDPEQLKQGVEQFRPMTDIIKELIAATKGRATILTEVFDQEAYRALTKVAAEFKDTKAFDTLDKFNNIKGDGAQLIGDSARAAGTFTAAMTQLNTEWSKFADANLTEPVRDLADLLNSLQPEKVQATMKALAYGAAVLGGLVVANKAIGLARSTAETFRYIRGGKGKGGSADLAGGVAGALAGGAGGAVPVVVTNWQGAGAAGLAGAAADVAGADAGKGGKVNAKGLRGIASRAGRWLGRGAGVLGGVLGAVDAVGSFMDGDTRGAVGAVGRTVGGLGGGALGSLLGPVGTVAGATGGAWGGEKLFTALYDYFAGQKDEAREIKGGLEITVRSDNGTTAQVTGLSSQTPGFELDVGRIAAEG